jgi:hypothetical protein
VRILLEFDTQGYELRVVAVARLLLDLQHVATMARALAVDRLQRDDIVFDWYFQKYSWMIEASSEDLGLGDLSLVRINSGSLKIEVKPGKLVQGLQKAFAQSFSYIIKNILYVDLEREKRGLDNQLKREEVLRDRLENAAKAFQLIKKIPDEDLREQFIESLKSSVLPFAMEHPPLKSAKLIEEPDGTEEDLVPDNRVDTNKPN